MMPTLRYYLIDVFSSTAYQGNPLAVVDTISTPLTDSQMRLIARQFNLSETTFVYPPTDPKATWRLRSFLPNGVEVFGAGHNSLGAWWWIANHGLLGDIVTNESAYYQQLGSDILPVQVCMTDRKFVITMRQGRPQFLNQHTNASSLAKSIGIGPFDIGFHCGEIFLDQAMVVTTSPARHLMIPVRNLDVLRSINFADKEAISQELATTESLNSGIYAFTPINPESAEIPRFETRFFSPGMSMEDPATGSAAGPLAAYLWKCDAFGVDNHISQIEVIQGVQMGRKCLMRLSIEPLNDDSVSILISGTAVLVADGNIAIPGSDLTFERIDAFR